MGGIHMKYLLPFLIIIPATEITLLIYAGKTIGLFPTLLIMLFTAGTGAYLAKKQGLAILQKAKQQLAYGQVPGESIMDGVCVLIGGTLLLAPGFLTDIMGLFLLLPVTRKLIKPFLVRWLQHMFMNNRFTIIRR